MGEALEQIPYEASDEVALLHSDALWRLLSTSSTVYYVDMRGHRPLLMRARGTGHTAAGPYDNTWVNLTHVASGPKLFDGDRELTRDEIDRNDTRGWVLRLGSRHEFDFHVHGGFADTTDYWWIQRPLTAFERLDEMPPDDELTAVEQIPRPDMPARGE